MDKLKVDQPPKNQLNLFSFNDDLFNEDQKKLEIEYGNILLETISDERTNENKTVIQKKKKPILCQHYRWTNYEDNILRKLVEEFGENDWRHLAKKMDGRNSRQCRERWKNYLDPNLKIGDWTQEEDELIISKVKEIGQKWMTIKNFFTNRTDAMIKNRYRYLMKNKNKKVETFFDYLIRANKDDSDNNTENLNKVNQSKTSIKNLKKSKKIEEPDYLNYLKNDVNDDDINTHNYDDQLFSS